MANNNFLDQIESGEIARLIPAIADAKRKERTTTSLLAPFMVVPAFASTVLASVGDPHTP